MTVEEQAVPTEIAPQSGVQQIPAVIKVREAPGVSGAREQLLQAIAKEAQQVTDTQPGNASAALEQLARAYALVAAPAIGVPSPAGPAAALAPQGRSADSLRYVFEYEFNPDENPLSGM